MKHFVLFGILILSVILIANYDPIFASHGNSHEETQHNQGHKKTIYVNSELSDCVGISPQKCMQIRDSVESSWDHFYDKIHGFTYESGFAYHLEVLITDVENPPADASSKKYELVKILSKNPRSMHSGNMDNSMGQHGMKDNMMGNHHMSYKGMCAAGFASLDGMCVLDDRCGAGAYAGKVCVMDGVMKQYLRPLHQKHAGISSENIICAEGTELMFKHHDGSPACIKSKSIEKIKHRGWQTQMPDLACTLEYMPVCGIDGVSYGNMCAMNANHMAMKHNGACVEQ